MAQEPQHRDGRASSGQNISAVDVVEAARLLGMSPSAVRRRIRRGELAAHKVNGKWRVVMDSEEVAEDGTEAAVSADQDLVQIEAARRQLEAIRDEWIQPFVLQISHQAERIGRLSERLSDVERERDQLREERNVLRARLRAPESEPDEEPEPGFAGIAAFFNRVKVNDQIAIVGIVVVLLLWIVSGLAIWWAFS